MQIVKRRDLLKSMNDIAFRMREVILKDYFDTYDKDVLSMFVDAFNGVDLFCAAVKQIYISQSALILRQLLEEVSIVQILVNHPELLPAYKEHTKFKIEINALPKNEKIEKIVYKFHISKKMANDYFLDYGWISPEYKENDMIVFAGFSDYISWKSIYLNKFTHSSIASTYAIGDGSFPILDEFIKMVAKLFDHLCCAFHNYTSFTFKFDNKDLFANFRVVYSTFENYY